MKNAMKTQEPYLTGRGSFAALAAALWLAGIPDPTAHTQDLDPRLIGQWSPEFEDVSGVAIQGDIAWVVTASGWNPTTRSDVIGGLRVIDVHDPATPRLIGQYDYDKRDTHGATLLAVSGDYAYVLIGARNEIPARLEVMDVSNPSDPQRVGGYHKGVGQIK